MFDSKQKLSTHSRVAHSTDKRYECKHCGQRCRSLGARKAHEMTHEGLQFQCRHCPKKVRTAENLKAHERYSFINSILGLPRLQ